jgi:hypothetical protein
MSFISTISRTTLAIGLAASSAYLGYLVGLKQAEVNAKKKTVNDKKAKAREPQPATSEKTEVQANAAGAEQPAVTDQLNFDDEKHLLCPSDALAVFEIRFSDLAASKSYGKIASLLEEYDFNLRGLKSLILAAGRRDILTNGSVPAAIHKAIWVICADFDVNNNECRVVYVDQGRSAYAERMRQRLNSRNIWWSASVSLVNANADKFLQPMDERYAVIYAELLSKINNHVPEGLNNPRSMSPMGGEDYPEKEGVETFADFVNNPSDLT